MEKTLEALKKAPKIVTRLIEDKSFQAWTIKSNTSDQAYWEEWISLHPEYREQVDIAAEIIRGIKFSRKRLSPAEINEAWQDLRHKIGEPKRFRNTWLSAASLAGLAIITTALWLWLSPKADEVVYQTPFGKTASWQLPDGSKLTLNAHSKVTYKVSDQPYPIREVSLDGEAYFEVVHLGENEAIPFLVKTPDLTIKVLGTEFNVSTRQGLTRVVLDAGNVQLQLPTEAVTAMSPGELVEYTPLDNEIRKERVDTEVFTSWRKHLLKFDDTPLGKVALIIEDNYGVDVTFEDPSLRLIRVTGEISDKNLETLLLALSKLFDLDVEHSRHAVHFKKMTKP